jgi:hypothetical protein
MGLHWDTTSVTIENLFRNSANLCLELRSLVPHPGAGAARAAGADDAAGKKQHKTTLGRNIDALRKECGWSFDDISKASEIAKKLILGHVNDGKGAHPSTLAEYARTFSEKLGRHVTVAELEALNPKSP